jgi:peptidoglycan/xylan/chitin deacetylase (PgdA/CDA1 family)
VISRHTKSFLKQFASPVLDRMGLYDRHLRKMSSACWTIVMYHRIIDHPSADPFDLGMCVEQTHFDEQLRYFKNNFNIIGLAQAASLIAQGQSLPARSLSVTFDDGYLDNQTLALPLLLKHQVPMTLFVPTGGLQEGAPLWWDRVIHALDATDQYELNPADLGLPLSPTLLPLKGTQRRQTVQLVLNSLWTLPQARIFDCVALLERSLTSVRRVAAVAARMAPSQLLQMHQAGIELAAHSVNHPNLTLEEPQCVLQEMLQSKHTLEQLCGAPIQGFAYPAGWKNPQVTAAAFEAGFSYAAGTVSGVNHVELNKNLFSLRRVGMPNTPVADFKRAFATIIQRANSLP